MIYLRLDCEKQPAEIKFIYCDSSLIRITAKGTLFNILINCLKRTVLDWPILKKNSLSSFQSHCFKH